MSEPLLIASGNSDKVAELSKLLSSCGWAIKTLGDFDPVAEPIEDADTFEGNALLKARYYESQFKVACVSDDSGIEVDALDGAPGVYSARYAGEVCTYADNNRKLLLELEAIPEAKRSARFICCAAFVNPQGESFVEFGTITGRISNTIRGDGGFGYDPVFIPDGHDRTFGELAPEVKQSISHRSQAFQRMRDRLLEQV